MDSHKRFAEDMLQMPSTKRPKLDGDDDIDSLSSNEVILFNVGGYKFHPAFTNQIINDTETIQGYDNIAINIHLSPITLRPYVKISYDAKEPDSTDVKGALIKFYKENAAQTKGEFDIWVAEDAVVQFATEPKTIIHSDKKEYFLYLINQRSPDFYRINTYFQKLMIYFIDGSSEIEVDSYWTYYLLVSKKEKMTVGFATTYQFYQNALTMRSRISQYFILPPFQKIGLGKIILQEIYKNSMADTRCIEITIEDPSDDFLCMRNLYDIRYLLNQSHFKEFKTHPKITNFNYKSFKLGKQERDDIHRLYKFTLNRVLG